jgi:aspartyl-tRNA synthetase
MSTFLAKHKRTHGCGALRAADVGKEVVLTGWVDTRRDHGDCVFIDLRDREGLTQVVFDPSVNVWAHQLAGELRREFCIGIHGTVTSRGSQVNPRLATGEVEVRCDTLEIFARAETPPFAIEDDTDANEALRLQYRYLDLRRPRFQRALRLPRSCARCGCARRPRRRPAATCSTTASPRSRPRSWSSTRPAARATSWCRRG